MPGKVLNVGPVVMDIRPPQPGAPKPQPMPPTAPPDDKIDLHNLVSLIAMDPNLAKELCPGVATGSLQGLTVNDHGVPCFQVTNPTKLVQARAQLNAQRIKTQKETSQMDPVQARQFIAKAVGDPEEQRSLATFAEYANDPGYDEQSPYGAANRTQLLPQMAKIARARGYGPGQAMIGFEGPDGSPLNYDAMTQQVYKLDPTTMSATILPSEQAAAIIQAEVAANQQTFRKVASKVMPIVKKTAVLGVGAPRMEAQMRVGAPQMEGRQGGKPGKLEVGEPSDIRSAPQLAMGQVQKEPTETSFNSGPVAMEDNE